MSNPNCANVYRFCWNKYVRDTYYHVLIATELVHTEMDLVLVRVILRGLSGSLWCSYFMLRRWYLEVVTSLR